jgi:hypothetical protein
MRQPPCAAKEAARMAHDETFPTHQDWQDLVTILAALAQCTGRRAELDAELARWFPTPDGDACATASPAVNAIRSAWSRWDTEIAGIMEKIRPQGSAD